MRTASVYVHFPYCLEKCPYCDFVSYKTEREHIDHEGYANAVVDELRARRRQLDAAWTEHPVRSVFFGGGTPSLWEPASLGRVLHAVRDAFRTTDDFEVTVECNPTSLDVERARRLRDVGVNRLSIGTQSLRNDQLRFLGRLHDDDGARRAVTGALSVEGIRVSTDMIFGLPGQTPEDARAQARELADLGLRHLSCYQLTIESGTRFGELARRGRLPLADEGHVAESFLAIDEELATHGLAHYEISNYAAPGQESLHNLAYWHGDEYVGLGVGAYGFVRSPRATRTRNEVDPARYVANASDLGRITSSSEELDGEALLRERIMLGLRLAEGFDLGEAAAELGVDPFPPAREDELRKLVARGRVARDGTRLRIPKEAWLLTDDTVARLF
ncbi:MAG: radical SAM family heme chaperone HemW [Polyangiaceae bacterium]